MSSRLALISLSSCIVLSACSTFDRTNHANLPSHYSSTSPYQTVAAPISYNASQAPRLYNASTNTQTGPSQVLADGTPIYKHQDKNCLKKERNRLLAGSALGGAAGAYAGKELIGGTKGLIAGAAVGAAAGYGVGDKLVTCDPVEYAVQQPTQTYQPQAQTAVIQQPAPDVETRTYMQAPSQPQIQNQTQSQAQVQVQPRPGTTYTQSPQPYSGQTVVYDQSTQLQPQQTVVYSQASQPQPEQARLVRSQTVQHSTSGSYMMNSAVSLYNVQPGDTVYSLSRDICVVPSDIQSLNGLNSDFRINIGDTIKLPARRC